MALIDLAASLAPGGRVRLVEVDGSEFSAGIHRFHYSPFPHTPEEIDAAGGEEDKLGPKPIIWNGDAYDFWPFQVADLELSTDQAAEPSLTVSNLDGTISALCLQFKDMVNAKVTIIDTYAIYLDADNYPGGVNATADPTMFTAQTFWLDTKSAEDDETVTWTLSSPADLQNMLIPTRQITSLCEWALRGQYRSGDGCTYNGTAYFDAKGNAVADPALDDCGGCLSDCRKRFGANMADPNAAILDFGGYPSSVLISQ
ncbi:phage minor tail protein L [Klebsiella sp. WP3-W18-ESBL-02]|uniref:phage minor tail protein L n=1 Tax=Klebsiella sp. WP3-W18-ESBL-02 TaxID=2675710 RepID=UPI0015DBE12B|nr:phage minor tail protein L [Klebsiella sp. WP3-W18-ESBL-02]BBQ83454.1 phage minor tail protein L [Klebsiella sp. WP3-W18-ESBL-02]